MSEEILEDRTYVEIHMMQTIDGKTTGDFWEKPGVFEGVKEWFNLTPQLKPQALALGRTSMVENYCGEALDLSKYKNKEKIEHKDFVIPLEKDIKYYFVAYDSKGTINYTSNILNPREWIKDGSKMPCQIIEVVSDNVCNEYLHYCQEKKISYIFAGKDRIDIKERLIKLKK